MGQSSTPEASLVPRCSHGHSVGLLTAIATVWLGAAAQAQVVDAAALEQEARDLRAEVRRLTSEQRYGEAIPKAERLIIVAEQLFGPSHPTVATLLTNLAELYERMGRDDDARTVRRRAQRIDAPTRGEYGSPAQREVHSVLVQAKTQFDLGDYPGAWRRVERAGELLRAANLVETSDYAVVLNEAGRLYHAMRGLVQAESLYQRSVRTAEALGPTGRRYLISPLNNLGQLYWEQRRLADAEGVLTRAIAIGDSVLDRADPQMAPPEVNLGLVLEFQGKPDAAHEMFLRARDLIVAAYGPDHPELHLVYDNLAALEWRRANVDELIRWQEQANRVAAKNIVNNIVLGSEQQKHLYMATFVDEGDASVSLSLGLGYGRRRAGVLAFLSVVQRKGRVVDAISQSLQRLRESPSASDRRLLEEYISIQRAKAEAVYAREGSGAGGAVSNPALNADRVEQLHVVLGERSKAFKDLHEDVSVDALRAALPDSSALIEFVLYRPRRPAEDSAAFLSDPPRYAAYVLLPSGELYWRDLGAREDVDRGISDFQRALSDPRSTYVKRAAQALYHSILLPFQPLLSTTEHVFLAPDATLNLIPFGALVDDSGRYLVQRYTFSYLSSSRDLLRHPQGARTRPAGPPVIVADPDYGRLGNGSTAQCAEASRGATRSLEDGFDRLCGTRQVATAIARILPAATVLSGSHATETAVKGLRRPAILHVATHGFYLVDVPSQTPRGGQADGEADAFSGLDRALLTSGLALAGANQRRSGADDGILTALEATALDLSGTQLVVLSACQTGVGRVMAGEGVFGLRRALVVAGAETQIMSLWKVSDAATASLMARYFELLVKGEGRSRALTQAQREMLIDRTHDWSHPYYWASFIPSGDWGPLDLAGLVTH